MREHTDVNTNSHREGYGLGVSFSKLLMDNSINLTVNSKLYHKPDLAGFRC